MADLPYMADVLTQRGMYAYLDKIPPKKSETSKDSEKDQKGDKKSKKIIKEDTVKTSRLRIVKFMTLCDGPMTWEKLKRKSVKNLPVFNIKERVFATQDIIDVYLNGPELKSFKSRVTEGDTAKQKVNIITDESFLTDESLKIAELEYIKYSSYDKPQITDGVTLDNLLQTFGVKKSIRKRTKKPVEKDEKPDEVKAVPQKESRPKVPSKRVSLKQQYDKVSEHPSLVVDVSSYGRTVRNTRGVILNRVKHQARIAKCIEISGGPPIVSNNSTSFIRAMNALGPAFKKYIYEFTELERSIEIKNMERKHDKDEDIAAMKTVKVEEVKPKDKSVEKAAEPEESDEENEDEEEASDDEEEEEEDD